MPYTQGFDETQLPNGWHCYRGLLVWDSGNNTGTADLTNASNWSFNTANSVFGSSIHAYTLIGGSNNQYKWLVSPKITVNDDPNACLLVDLALTRVGGNMVPVTPGQQPQERFGIYITDDEGATWHKVKTFGNVDQGDDLSFEENLTPATGHFAFNVHEYANRDVKIGFYASNSNAANNAPNNIHLDDFKIEYYNLAQAPATVNVSNIATHSARVNWSSNNAVQKEWDVAVACLGNQSRLYYRSTGDCYGACLRQHQDHNGANVGHRIQGMGALQRRNRRR